MRTDIVGMAIDRAKHTHAHERGGRPEKRSSVHAEDFHPAYQFCQPKYRMCLSVPSSRIGAPYDHATHSIASALSSLPPIMAAHQVNGINLQQHGGPCSVSVPLPGGRTCADVKTPAHDLACLSVAFPRLPSTVTASRFDRR